MLSKKNKKFIVIAGIIVVAVILGVVIFSVTVGAIIKGEILKALPEDSSVESVSYYPFSSSVTITNLRIPNPRGYTSHRDTVCAKKIYADLNLPALFRRVIYFEELNVGEVNFNVEFKEIPTSFSDLMRLAWTRSGVNLLDLQKKEKTVSQKQMPQTPQSASTGKSEKKAEPWKMRIDHLKIAPSKIYFGNLEVSSKVVDSAIDELLKKLPVKLPGGNTTKNAIIVFCRNTLAPYIKKGMMKLREMPMTLPQYEQHYLGQDEKTTCAGVACEIAERHWNNCIETCEEKLQYYRDILQKKWTTIEKGSKEIIKKAEKWRKWIPPFSKRK